MRARGEGHDHLQQRLAHDAALVRRARHPREGHRGEVPQQRSRAELVRLAAAAAAAALALERHHRRAMRRVSQRPTIVTSAAALSSRRGQQ